MASSLNDTSRNLMLDQLGTVAVFASLHTASPGSGGASEVSGGSPAYARKAITWSAAATSSKAASNSPVFDVPAGTTVAFVGLWSLATAGTFYVFSMDGTGIGDHVDEARQRAEDEMLLMLAA